MLPLTSELGFTMETDLNLQALTDQEVGTGCGSLHVAAMPPHRNLCENSGEIQSSIIQGEKSDASATLDKLV